MWQGENGLLEKAGWGGKEVEVCSVQRGVWSAQGSALETVMSQSKALHQWTIRQVENGLDHWAKMLWSVAQGPAGGWLLAASLSDHQHVEQHC